MRDKNKDTYGFSRRNYNSFSPIIGISGTLIMGALVT
jgi:hypothetical protein